LFFAYVLPVFTWLLSFFLLFIKNQQDNLNHFYYICFKRVYFCIQRQGPFVSYFSNKTSLNDRCRNYWEKYLDALSENEERLLYFQEANLNIFREAWLSKDMNVRGIYRSKQFVNHSSTLERIVRWCAIVPSIDAIANFTSENTFALSYFPETF
jgi:hypothetical protein